MIDFDDVSVSFGEHQVLAGVNLHVEEGTLNLVTGVTGAGKSTLLGCVNGLVPHFTGGTLTGRVLVDGRDTARFRPRDLSDVVALVGQDPAAGFVTGTVEDEIAYGMESTGVPADVMRRRVEETLDLLGIASLRARDLATLSGGQQQRVAIAAVLAPGPRVLVLDEPTSALDPVAAEEVLASITRVVHDLGLTVLCSEHRLERVIAFADTLITVEQGRVSGGSVPDAIRDAVLAPPLVQLGRLLQLDPLPLTIRDARRATNATREKLVNRDSDAALERNTWPAGPAGRAAPAIRLQGVSVYRGQHRALTGVNLEAAPGQVVAIMGRNGSGKSTLLGALAGLYRPAAGRVRVGGQNPAGLPAAQLVRRIALLPQEPNLVLYGASARHEASTADRDAGLPPGTTLARWSDLAGAGTEAADPDTHPRDLSEGQRLALALAVLLAPDPPVVAVDEPTRGLDYLAKNRLVAWLARLATDGRCVLVATHDVEFAAQCANRVVQLADGEVVLDTEATRALATSPAFAPQVAKVLRPLPILTVEQLSAALEPDP